MNTHNDVMKKGKIFCGLRSITLLAVAMLAASVAVTGCSKPDSSDGRTSGGNTIKCGTATCNKLTQKCENDKCVPKMPSTVPCGTSSCNAATQECVDGNKCVNKCGDTVCSDAQNCVGGQCVAKGGTTPCGSTTCDDDTQECRNNTCVTRTIECGTGASRRLCNAAIQECRNGSCAKKGSEVTCDPDFQVKQGDVCVIKNAGDGTCSSSPCTGSDICQSGTCVSVCKFCDESANYVGCFSKTIPCEYDTDSGKYMAVNRSTNPPTKTECKNPICGRKTTRDSQGHSPCYTPLKGDCAEGLECIQIGSNSYQCTNKPPEKLPCGGTCQNGETCNPTSNQCESTPVHTVPTCDDSAVTNPSSVVPLTFTQDSDPDFSYRSVATVRSQDAPAYSAEVGSFEQAMSRCYNTSPLKTRTAYKAFSFTLNKYANLKFYAKAENHPTTNASDHPALSLALFNSDKCSASLFCSGNFNLADVSSSANSLGADNGSKEALPPGNYYVIVKDVNVNGNNTPKYNWELSVEKSEYEQAKECTIPETKGELKCLDNNKTYGYCRLEPSIPSISPFEYSCLTTTGSNQATQAGCFYKNASSSTDASCYGLTYNDPIVVNGSAANTFDFNLKTPAHGKSAYKGSGASEDTDNHSNIVHFTNNTCNTSIAHDDIKSTYIIKIENLKPNATILISVPSAEALKTISDPTTLSLKTEAVAVRIQKATAHGEDATCIYNQTVNGSSLTSDPQQSPFEFSFSPNNSSTETYYITLSTTAFSYVTTTKREHLGFALTIK